MQSPWQASSDAAATEHTGEPQLAGYVHTHAVNYDGNATEHANAGSSSGEWPIVATEHDDGPDILFTIDDASERRRSFRGQPGRLHSEARKRLNAVTEIAAQDDADEVYCIGDTFRWKDYIAWHDDCNEIIGTGIIAAHLEKIRGTTDHNRANNARVDYVFYRSNNTYCRVHPGTKRKNDAQLNIASTSTCSRAVQAYEVAPNPMTLQQAVQIPVIDKMGKAEAWQQLSQRDEAEFDVTEHDPFKWWLFLSNLGDKTEKAFRDGITGVHVRKEENRIGLRIMYTDSSVQWVILTPSRNTCKTRLVTSFDEESIDEAAARLKYGRQPSTASGSDTWQAPAQWQWHGDTWQAPAQWQWQRHGH